MARSVALQRLDIEASCLSRGGSGSAASTAAASSLGRSNVTSLAEVSATCTHVAAERGLVADKLEVQRTEAVRSA